VSIGIGSIRMPGEERTTRTKVIPRPRLSGAPVRHSSMVQVANCDSEFQRLRPVTTSSSPSTAAWHWMLAMSEPLSGSEKVSHHIMSPAMIGGRNRAFCSAVPSCMSVGARISCPKMSAGSGALASAHSSAKRSRSVAVAGRPPYSAGSPSPP
jgi:hypothetical protein